MNKKFALGIVAFEDFTVLQDILEEISECFDYSCIYLQEQSYDLMTSLEPEVYNKMLEYKSMGLVNDVIMAELDRTHQNGNLYEYMTIENSKREFIRKDLLNKRYDYALVIDSDEYYTKEQVYNVIKYLNQHSEIDATYCQGITYYKDLIHYITKPYTIYNFIAKTSIPFKYEIGNLHFDFDGKLSNYIDSTRAFDDTCNFVELPPEMVLCHHFSYIRNNITSKFLNYSQKIFAYKEVDQMPSKLLHAWANLDNTTERITYRLGSTIDREDYHISTLPYPLIKLTHFNIGGVQDVPYRSIIYFIARDNKMQSTYERIIQDLCNDLNKNFPDSIIHKSLLYLDNAIEKEMELSLTINHCADKAKTYYEHIFFIWADKDINSQLEFIKKYFNKVPKETKLIYHKNIPLYLKNDKTKFLVDNYGNIKFKNSVDIDNIILL